MSNSYSDWIYGELEDNEYDEEGYGYEYEEIDNSGLEYVNKDLYIRLNDKRNNYEVKKHRLDDSKRMLLKKYPSLDRFDSDSIVETVFKETFQEGFPKRMYVRNLTFTSNNGNEISVLGIRPAKCVEGEFLYDYFPEDTSLLFKGHLDKHEFVVDSIHEVADGEGLDYEVRVDARPFHTNIPDGPKGSFLYDVLNEAESLTKHTERNLEEWESYLSWRKELVRRQINGCKYYKVSFDYESRGLIFKLVFEGERGFKSFEKYLRRDIKAFSNSYSEDRWNFNLRKEDKSNRNFDRSIELGEYKCVMEEYYLSDIEGNSKDILDHYEDEEYSWEESELFDYFEAPYIVRVAFELSRNVQEDIEDKLANDEWEDIDNYIRENVVDKYYREGFLALSAVGDFALISRFENSISQLKRDESYSPTLALWLFNVSRARLPQVESSIEITKWLNKNIEKNEDQKTAVYKMLNAPDLCLIQGPPGTGKTTVIAEAIYQFIRTGNRVLIASQSNDAVDNALERLADTPEIRAIRLGQKGRQRKMKEENYSFKFSEDEALKGFYSSLSNNISEVWLDKWSKLEKLNSEYEMELRDTKLFQRDICELSRQIEIVSKDYEKTGAELRSMFKDLSNARRYNQEYENESRQLKGFKCSIESAREQDFYLNEEQIEKVAARIDSIVLDLMNQGIFLSPGNLDINLLGVKKANEYLGYALKSYWTLRSLVNRLRNLDNREVGNQESMIISRNIAEIDDRMMEEDDKENILRLVEEKRKLKRQLEDLEISSSTLSLSNVENSILSTEFKNRLMNTSSAYEESNRIATMIDRFEDAIRSAIDEIKLDAERRKPMKIEHILDSIERIKSKLEDLKLEREDYAKNLASKTNSLLDLSKKYGLETEDLETVIGQIENLYKDNLKKLEKDNETRSYWESTLKGFKDRLEDENLFKYDREYYQKTYIGACNVVGISCTDNMRHLVDNGHSDFDVVIIDEVSKATPPELLIPLMKGRKAILVGDHRQLPPMFNEHEKSYNELIKNQEDIPEEVKDLMTEESFSKFKNMVTSSLFKDYFENADKSIKHSLFTQYRMHSDIMDVINRFYEQRLNRGLSDEEENKLKSHGLTIKGVDGGTFIRPNAHAYWIDSSTLPNGDKFFETRPKWSTSAENILEQYIIIELLKKVAKECREHGYNRNNPKSVGVISFYQLQVNRLRRRFNKEKRSFDFSSISVDINTVDRFQGKEKQIIITSLVRSPIRVKRTEGSHIAAFERINVAFSRAQEMLLIVGSRDMYENQPVKLPNMDEVGDKTVFVYKNIIDELQRKACYMNCYKILDSETEKKIITEYQSEYGGKK